MQENDLLNIDFSQQGRKKFIASGLAGFRTVTCLGLLFSGILMLNGCAIYHSKAITPDSTGSGLVPPDRREIQVRATEFKHPLLKPVKIDFNDGLSPDEAAIIAVVVNPSLRVERDALALVKAQTFQAGILPNPQLSYSLDSPAGGTTAGTGNAFTAGLDLGVTSLISRSARIETAEKKQQEVNLYVAWKELQTAQASRSAVYRIRALKEQVTLLKEIEKRQNNNLAVVCEAQQNGLMTELDLWAAKDALNESITMLLSGENEINRQFILLKKVLGLPPDYDVRIQNNIRLPDHFNPPPFKKLIENLGEKRLDLLALQYGYKSKEAAVRVSVLEQFPKIGIGVTHARDNSNLYTLGFGVSIDLPVFDRNQGRIAIARASRQQLFDEYINRVFEAQSNIANTITTLHALNRQIKHTARAIEETNNLLTRYRQAIKERQVDILTYNNTRNRLTRKRIDLITLRSNLMETTITLAVESGYYKIEPYLPGAMIQSERMR